MKFKTKQKQQGSEKIGKFYILMTLLNMLSIKTVYIFGKIETENTEVIFFIGVNAFILLYSSSSILRILDNFPEFSSDRFSILIKAHFTSDLIIHSPTSCVLSEYFISFKVKSHFP